MSKQIALSYEDGRIGEPVDANWSLINDGEFLRIGFYGSVDLTVDLGVATGLAFLWDGEVASILPLWAQGVSRRVDAGQIVSIRGPVGADVDAIKDKSDE